MEENVTQNASPEATPNVETPQPTNEVSMQSGGSVSGEKLSWLAIMMLGLTTASLIYSIHYYFVLIIYVFRFLTIFFIKFVIVRHNIYLFL